MAARAASAPMTPKAATVASLIKWADQTDRRNVANALRYVLALLGNIDDRSR